MNIAIKAPEPGIYENVTFEEYLAWDCANNSRLCAAQRSALHLRDAFDNPPIESTPPMRLGSLTHTGKLEPLALPQRYVVMPRFEDQVRKADGTEYASPKATKEYKALVAEFEAANSDKQVVSQDEYDKMVGMVEALSHHHRASEYLSQPAQTEVSIVYDDPETGIRCKIRVDLLSLSRGHFVDLKTCRDASGTAFMYAMERYGYDQQMAMYRHGIEVATGKKLKAILVVVENERPYGVQAAPVSATTLYRGDFYYRRALRMLAHGRATGEWPGYEPIEEFSVRDGAIPDGAVEDTTLRI